MPARRPGRRSEGWWPPPSVPIAVEGGLQARSQRGRIGDTWWSQRFLAVLESFGLGSRLQRGKRYARAGQVLSMDIGPGQVTASVQGSRARPYRVFIETGVLDDTEWDAAERAMASSASFVAPLLAGDMPEDIEDAFSGASVTLFPSVAEGLDTACSCPDSENPCKHIAAVYFLLAEAFDRDPFLIFTWRGRSKEELLAGLRARRRGTEPTGDEEAPRSADDHGGRAARLFGWQMRESDADTAGEPSGPEELWGRPDELAAIEIRPRLAVAPDLLLRQLDPSALGEDAARIIDGLRPLYEAMTAGAATLALGEPAS